MDPGNHSDLDPEFYSFLDNLIVFPPVEDLPQFNELLNTQEPPTLMETDQLAPDVVTDEASPVGLPRPAQVTVGTGAPFGSYVAGVEAKPSTLQILAQIPIEPIGFAQGALDIPGISKVELKKKQHANTCRKSRAKLKSRNAEMKDKVSQYEEQKEEAKSENESALKVKDSYSQELNLIETDIKACEKRNRDLEKDIAAQEKRYKIFSGHSLKQLFGYDPLELLVLENVRDTLSDWDDYMSKKNQVQEEVEGMEREVENLEMTLSLLV